MSESIEVEIVESAGAFMRWLDKFPPDDLTIGLDGRVLNKEEIGLAVQPVKQAADNLRYLLAISDTPEMGHKSAEVTAKTYDIAGRLPFVVSAVRYKGDNRQECADFLGEYYGFEAPYVLIRSDGDHDDRKVRVGEWIVRDASGEFFAATSEGFTFWYGLRIPDGVYDAVDLWLEDNAPNGVEVSSEDVSRNVRWVQVKMWREGNARSSYGP